MTDGDPQPSSPITGEVVAGPWRLQFGSIHGASAVAADGPPSFQPRPLPVSLRPPAPQLVDRELELTELESALGPGAVVQLVGEHGTGRTALLLALAQNASSPPDGVVLVDGRGRTLDDVAAAIFDGFVANNARTIPGSDDIAAALVDKRALVIVDDLEVDASDAERLASLLPQSTLVVSTVPGVAVRGAKVIPIGGLPTEAAAAYVGRLIGRELDESEIEAAAAICAAVGGYPLRIRQALALVRGNPAELTTLAASLSGSDEGALARQVLAALSEPEQRVVAALALPERASIHPRHLSGLCGVAEAEEVARRLAGAGIVCADGKAARLSDDVAAEVEASWPLPTPRAMALGYLTGWAETNKQSPEAVAEEAQALVGLAHWAVGAERHREALRLAWAAESSLALAGRTGAWGRMLEAALRAAEVLGDRSAESWAVHEQAVRALAVDDGPGARELLTRAVSLREQGGDDEAADVSRQLLDVAPAGGRRKSGRPARSRGGSRRAAASGRGLRGGGLPKDRRGRLLLIASVLALAAVIVAVAVATRGGDDEATQDTTGVVTPPSDDPSAIPPEPGVDPVLPPGSEEPVAPVDVPPKVKVKGPPIQAGSAGKRVRALQRALKALGYDPGSVDGSYGPATRDAITQFQEDQGLDSDGVAGAGTIRAVNRALDALRQGDPATA